MCVCVCVCSKIDCGCHGYQCKDRHKKYMEPRAAHVLIHSYKNAFYLEEGILKVPVQVNGITGENIIQTTLEDGRGGERESEREGQI